MIVSVVLESESALLASNPKLIRFLFFVALNVIREVGGYACKQYTVYRACLNVYLTMMICTCLKNIF